MVNSRKLTLLTAQREKLLNLISVYESAVKEGLEVFDSCQKDKVLNISKFNEINTKANKIQNLKAETVSLESVSLSDNLEYSCDQAGCSNLASKCDNLVKNRVTKRFQCLYNGCDFASNWRHVVRRHLWKHFAVKPFRCRAKSCDYLTNRKDYLKRHYKNNHKK